MSKRYVSIRTEIDAVQWTGINEEEVKEFVGGDKISSICGNLQVFDELQNCTINANVNDYIIKGTEGEFYPCAEKVFLRKYEECNAV